LFPTRTVSATPERFTGKIAVTPNPRLASRDKFLPHLGNKNWPGFTHIMLKTVRSPINKPVKFFRKPQKIAP
jgi:hypothetical protein